MDMDFITDGASEDFFRFGQNNEEYTNFEGEVEGEAGERCGICVDIVIDRGVLDCCQHWFCFTCIDNWASITNLCPLCQHAFQSITCVPVYDTIGGDKFDEDSYSRDDDWSIEGTNNTLSFPSYYIDESAVICLDGDGCKMRSGSEATKTDSNLDTSIACDSCDVWYHAFCVGFDPEGSSENSWLCPRCVVDQVPEEPDYVSTSTYTHQEQAENGNSDCSIEGALSGKMLVAIADDGETAVVVSRVQEKQENEEFCADQSILKMLKVPKIEPFLTGSVASSPMSELSGVISCEPSLEPDKHEASLSELTCFDLPVDSSAQSDIMIKIDNQGKEEQKHVDPLEICSTSTCVSFVDGGGAMTEQSKELPVSRVSTGEKEGIVSVADVKRKHISNRSANNGKSKARVNGKIHLKNAEVDSGNQSMDTKDQTHMKDTGSRSDFKKEEVKVDIMDIVQGAERRRLKKPSAITSTISSSKERDSVAGLRVKKIMRRTNDNVVQNLRKEIRDVVVNKSSKDVGENLFDPKLLDAFRAVVTGNTVESKKPHVDMKAKKTIFQKGKVRENLTKKIYGMGGKRKRAWTRDCEIEFWKHRCLKVSKPEKIQTLQSVLSLLRNDADTDNKVMKRRKDGESTNPSTNPLLSRLYLADTSLLPRKDDIKPVNALDEITPKSILSANTAVTSANLSSEKTISIVKSETPSTKLPKNKSTERTPLSGSGGSNASSQQEKIGVSDVKTDKRKWALELLARKTAVTTKDVGQDAKGDSALPKGNFPQLALLPKDMRPVLASARHNKVPTAVRQTQLYRIAENFLKNINLPAMLRSAETELAVADAINVEKTIADRSNCKLVYMNLCSQELLRRTHSKNSNQTTETSISQTQLAQPDKVEVTNDDDSLDSEVTEALRNAGLLSDTPPSSPCDEPMEDIKEDMNFIEKIDDENGPDNILEIDSQADLDIYGDFEYDLEDDDFIGASTLKSSSLLHEESKLKVVFSTLCDDNKSKGESLDILYNENTENIQEASTSNDNLKNVGDVADDVSHFQNSTVDDEFKEPSLDECEQLYGPDKEPLFAEEMTHVGENGAGYESGASEKGSEPHSEHQQLTENVPTSSNLPVHEATDENLPDNENNASTRVNAVGNKQSNLHDHQSKDDVNANANKESDSPGHQQKDDAKANANKKSDSPGHQRKVDAKANANKKSDGHPSVTKKVEAYVKEHIRPLCKSGVITVEQYRWSIKKTTEKVMKYHSKDKNANFLVKEGEKVKKLAEQYVETAQQQMPKS